MSDPLAQSTDPLSAAARQATAGNRSWLDDRRLALIGLALIVLFHAACNVVWLRQDGRSFYGDPGNHARASMAISEILRQPSPDILARISKATTFWPPVAYLPAQALYALFGVSSDVTALATTLWLGLAIVLTFLVGQRLYGWRAGLLAAFVFSFYPAVYGQSRTAYADLALAAMTLLVLYGLLRTEAFSRRGRSLVLGLVMGLAALTKAAFLIMTIGPILATAGIALASGGRQAWRQLFGWRPGRRMEPAAVDLGRRLVNLALAGAIAVLLATPWYLNHLLILALAANDVTSEVHLTQKPFYWYALKFDEGLLIWPYLLLLVGLAVGLRHVRRHWFALTWLISGVVILTLVTRQNVRYLLPVLPAAALLSVQWIVALRSRGLRAALIGGTALFQIVLFFVMSWGAPKAWNLALDVPVQNAHNSFNDNTSDRELAIDPLAFLYYQYPPRPHRWPVQAILDTVLQAMG